MTVYKSGLHEWAAGTVEGTPFSVDGDKGANIWVGLTIPNGGSIVAQLQQGSPTGDWVDIPGALTSALAAEGSTLVKIYPSLTPLANQVVNTVLGGGAYRILATITGAPTGQVVVESIA